MGFKIGTKVQLYSFLLDQKRTKTCLPAGNQGRAIASRLLPFSGKSKAKKLKFLLRFSQKMTFTAWRHRVRTWLALFFEMLNSIYLMFFSEQCVDVHEKSEPQVSWLWGARFLRVKRKLEVGFRGRFFFVSFFWRIKRKKKLYNH